MNKFSTKIKKSPTTKRGPVYKKKVFNSTPRRKKQIKYFTTRR